MKTQPGKLLLLAAAALLALTCGCNDFVLLSPLPTVSDDRIVGSWANSDGKLDSVIKRGTDGGYEYSTAEKLTQGGKPTTLFLARAGSLLFAERQADCTDFAFQTPSPKDAPQGCWAVYKVIVTADTLEFDQIDASLMLKKSVAGSLSGVNLLYGTSVDKEGKVPSTDVLATGSNAEIAAFLESYGKGEVYSNSTKLHRI